MRAWQRAINDNEFLQDRNLNGPWKRGLIKFQSDLLSADNAAAEERERQERNRKSDSFGRNEQGAIYLAAFLVSVVKIYNGT